jgi:hypothetical protein
MAAQLRRPTPFQAGHAPGATGKIRFVRTVGGRARERHTHARVPAATARAIPLGLAALQRTAGNRAVAGLVVQRAPLLDDAQATRAITFYASQPARYPRATMIEIQALLGVPRTGRADRATVEGIAGRQAANTSQPRLAVDGMAGPRTLPRLFPDGLNLASEIAAYNSGINGVMDARTWRGLDVDARRTRLGEVINARLAAAGVPSMTMVPSGPNFIPRAEFRPATWQFTIRDNILAKSTLDPAEADDLAKTLYHEGRHAQQIFRAAQFDAKHGTPVDQLGIEPTTVAPLAHARRNDLSPMQETIAAHWSDDRKEPAVTKYRQVTAAAACDVVAFRCARNRAEANPGDRALAAELERARIRRDAALARYQDLPLENDAYATQDLLGRSGEADEDPDACSKLCAVPHP